MEKTDVLKKIYSKIDEIPTLPAVVPKLLSVMESEKANATNIADTISTDPALTSKILKVANSAYYGFSQEVLSLKLAMSLLGHNMVKSLALSLGVINSLPSGKSSTGFSNEGLWIHSLAVATLMQELGKRFRKEGNADQFFIVGLLHDIGKIVLNQFFSELFQKALEQVHNEGMVGLHIAESSLIGFDHGEIGAMLLTRWKFPDVISDAIAVHHQRGAVEGRNGRDAAMLRVANTLPQELGMGQDGNPSPPPISEQDLKTLEMEENDVDEMREYLAGVKDKIYALFDAMA